MLRPAIAGAEGHQLGLLGPFKGDAGPGDDVEGTYQRIVIMEDVIRLYMNSV